MTNQTKDASQTERDSLTLIRALVAALQENHQWHMEYNDHNSYDDSLLCSQNHNAISDGLHFIREVEAARSLPQATSDEVEALAVRLKWCRSQVKGAALCTHLESVAADAITLLRRAPSQATQDVSLNASPVVPRKSDSHPATVAGLTAAEALNDALAQCGGIPADAANPQFLLRKLREAGFVVEPQHIGGVDPPSGETVGREGKDELAGGKCYCGRDAAQVHHRMKPVFTCAEHSLHATAAPQPPPPESREADTDELRNGVRWLYDRWRGRGAGMLIDLSRGQARAIKNFIGEDSREAAPQGETK